MYRPCPAVLSRFFEDYKKNENKHVRVDEILGAEEAIKAVKDGLVRGRDLSHCMLAELPGTL
jgi:inorganic pyrophosphatase